MNPNLRIHTCILQFLFLIVLLQLGTACTFNSNKTGETTPVKTDSVNILVQQSKNKAIAIQKRQAYLRQAYQINSLQKNDSLKNRNLLNIAYEAYRLDDSTFFKKTNKQAQQLSVKIRDTFGIGDTHWNFASDYVKREVMDSAYYHYHQALEAFAAINHDYYAGKMLYNMAFVQGLAKDYTGSEISAFQAIAKFERLNKPLNLYRCYNLLGNNYKGLGEHKKGTSYYLKAMKFLDEVTEKGSHKEATLNNLGLVYRLQGNFSKAIEHFNEAIDNNDQLKNQDALQYAMLLDNLAYTKFLSGDTTNVLPDFLKALHIRDGLHNKTAVLINKLHMAEFYAKYSDTTKAILYAKEAKLLATQVRNNRDILASLLLLSKIDKRDAAGYLSMHVSLSDSLQSEERKLRNKFTRIRFETDEYIEETEKLSQQKLQISVAGLIVLIVLSLVYFIRVQRAKNKELLLESAQQKANEEIYALLLKQQSKLEEGRLKERHRIAEDMHDGVLGRIFGTRMGLGFLKIKGDTKTMEQHQSFVNELQYIEKEIRDISHELKNELVSSEQHFIRIIEDLAEKQHTFGHFKYTISCDEAVHWNEVDEKIKINCYRIVQEALQNITKYAKATLVTINFTISDKILKLVIHDNGLGFDTLKKKKGIGLNNMQSRAEKMKGEFSVSSSSEKGTMLTLLIPL